MAAHPVLYCAMHLRSRLSVLATLALVACGSAALPPPTAPAPVAVAPAAPPALAPGQDPLDREVKLDPRIRTGKLANGLTYYILPHQHPRARAQLWLAVNAGSTQEDDDQRGLAHLVEHMAFNGTKHFPKQAIIDYMEKSGMNFGADVNAYTSFDQTVYQLTVPTDDQQVVVTGLDVLRDWAGEVTFDPDEVDKERGVVLEEWRLGRGAWMRLFDKQAKTLFHGSRYADRITIGLPEVIKKAPRNAIVRFYKDWYRPDLMAVIAVGDFQPDEIEAAIKSKFGDLTGPARPRARTLAPIPHDHDLLVSIETDPEMPYTQIAIYDKLDHRPERSVGDYRRFLVEDLYHQMLNQRLEQISRTPGGPFMNAFSGGEDLGRTADSIVRQAQAQAGRAEDALAGLFREVLRVERHGFSAAELERAKKDLLRGFENGAREHDKTEAREYADELTRQFFTAEMMPGRETELAIVKELLPGIALAEENQLARSTGPKGRAILISGPARSPLPDQAKVVAIIDSVAKDKVEAWSDTPPPASLMAARPTPGKVTATRTIPEIGVTEWTLSNGAKVVVKPTDFKNDEVQLHGFSPGGTSLVADKDFDSARMAASVVNDGGVGSLDPVALERALAGRRARANAWIGELEEGVNATSSPDDLEAMLQLVHLRFTAPRRDEQAFAAWKIRQRERAANRRLMPESAFYEDMSSFVAQKHKRRAPVTPEVVDQVDLDKSLAIYKDRFGDAGDFTFVIVGNVELDTLQPLVETYLASLPAKGRKEKWKDVGGHWPKGHKTLDVNQGSEPKSFVYYESFARQAWSKDVEHDLHILEMLLDIRLREVMREDMSGVYGVQVWAYSERRPRQERQFGVSFGCDPANVVKLRDAVMSTVAAVQKDGLGELYLTKVKEQIQRRQETDLRENGFWLYQLADAWRYGDDPRDIPDVKPVLARITLPNIKAAAKKYLDSQDSVLAVLRPVAAAAAPAATP